MSSAPTARPCGFASTVRARCRCRCRWPFTMLMTFSGPYGDHGFSYRRFPVVMMVTGGIGVTPAISMLKVCLCLFAWLQSLDPCLWQDIYRVGDLTASQRAGLPHCIKAVYMTCVARFVHFLFNLPRALWQMDHSVGNRVRMVRGGLRCSIPALD